MQTRTQEDDRPRKLPTQFTNKRLSNYLLRDPTQLSTRSERLRPRRRVQDGRSEHQQVLAKVRMDRLRRLRPDAGFECLRRNILGLFQEANFATRLLDGREEHESLPCLHVACC